MIRQQVQLTRRQLVRLRALAARRGTSVAEVVRDAIDRVPDAPGASDDEVRRRAIEAAGRYASGRRDGSREHDAVFADAVRR